MKTIAARGDAGFALLSVFVISLAVFAFGLSFLALAGHETASSQRSLDSERAFWLAEAGRERTLQWMESQFRPPDFDVVPFDPQTGPDGGTYAVHVRVNPANIYKAEKKFLIESVGTFGRTERRVVESVSMKSFASYAYFTNSEQGQTERLWFVNSDVLEGPVHSNDILNIHGSPRFLGPVTSAADHMLAFHNSGGQADHVQVTAPEQFPIYDNDPYFKEPFQLGKNPIPLPKNTADLKARAQQDGWYILADPRGDVTLELGKVGALGVDKPGWLRWKYGNDVWGSQPDKNLQAIPGQVIYSEGGLKISGVLDGEITISSAENITIVEDLTYAASQNGVPRPNCDDMLGLVAGKNIVFADITATDNLKVDGVMMALETSIKAESYNNGRLRGKLTVWGGLIQTTRGPVGRHDDNGNIYSGYSKDYHYDDRVTSRTPPHFPMPGTYIEDGWQETWNNVAF